MDIFFFCFKLVFSLVVCDIRKTTCALCTRAMMLCGVVRRSWLVDVDAGHHGSAEGTDEMGCLTYLGSVS